jgi:hypothetical protein
MTPAPRAATLSGHRSTAKGRQCFLIAFLSGVPGRLVGGLSLRGEEPSMLAEAHRVLWCITHRHHPGGQDELIGRLPGMGQRRRWARAVYRLLEEVSRCQPWWQSPHPYWDFPPLTSREVVWACRPALLAIAGALGDQRQPISAVACGSSSGS